MITIKNEDVVWIDVDDTLVMWPDNPFQPGEGLLQFDQYNQTVWLKPNEKNIKLLKNYYERGYFVIVHSANGYNWASEVVTKLLLRSCVNMVFTKPMKYVDDLPAEEWMQRVYINEVGINE